MTTPTPDGLLTDDRLKAIEDRANAATQGPWLEVCGDDEYCSAVAGLITEAEQQRIKAHTGRGEFPEDTKWIIVDPGVAPANGRVPEDNWTFIAHAREDVPALIREIRRQGEVITSLIQMVEEYQTGHDMDAKWAANSRSCTCQSCVDARKLLAEIVAVEGTKPT